MASLPYQSPDATPSTAYPKMRRALWCDDCAWDLARSLWVEANGDMPGPSFDDLADDERKAWFDHARATVSGGDA